MATLAVMLTLVGTFSSPVYVAAPPGDTHRIFVVEQGGTIRVVQDGTVQSTPFLTIPPNQIVSGGEEGLLGLAFAPDYATSGTFYVYYTATAADSSTAGSDIVIARGTRSTANPNVAAPGLTELLRIPHRLEDNHVGGTVVFGPDGMLYAGTGDGGGAGDNHHNGQNVNDPINNATEHNWQLGKILRIDPSATPPITPTIWSYGLRNPYRFTFDRLTGDLVIGDVGQGDVEEIDFAPAASGTGQGDNFGWNHYEGNELYSGGDALNPMGPYVAPVITQTHGDGWCAIIGGVVVHDSTLPALDGRYLYSDNCLGDVWSASLSASGASGNADTGLNVPRASGFGQDACGHVYVTSLQGPVYRLDQGVAGCPAVPGETGPAGGGGASGGTSGGGAGSGGGGSSGGGSGVAKPAAAKLTLHGQQQRLHHGRISLRLRCSVACTAHVFSPSAVAPVTRQLPAKRQRSVSLRLFRRARVAIVDALAGGRTPHVHVTITVRSPKRPTRRYAVSVAISGRT